jgi:hypothetical protein
MADQVALSLEYRLTGCGWSECRLVSSRAEVTITASYLTDALGNLAAAALELLNGASSARCSFDEEPGEYRWVLDAAEGSLLVRVLEFQELWSDAPDTEGTVVFRCSCTVLTFGTAVYEALSRVLAKEGMAGYKSKWVEHAFPLDAFRQIEAVLTTRGTVT